MIYFGTSDFSYNDWVGNFYPVGMPKREWLTHYARFHGRNRAKWWQHEQAYERYDYSYTSEELSEWLPKIQKLDSVAEKTFVFANNHGHGQAVSTIRQLRIMLN